MIQVVYQKSGKIRPLSPQIQHRITQKASARGLSTRRLDCAIQNTSLHVHSVDGQDTHSG